MLLVNASRDKYRDSCTLILALLPHLKIATTIATIILSMRANPLLRDLMEPGKQDENRSTSKVEIFCNWDEPVPVISAPFHICHRLRQQLELNHYDCNHQIKFSWYLTNWILVALPQFLFSNAKTHKYTNPGEHRQEREDGGFWDELGYLVDTLVHCLGNGIDFSSLSSSPLLHQLSWPCSSPSSLRINHPQWGFLMMASYKIVTWNSCCWGWSFLPQVTLQSTFSTSTWVCDEHENLVGYDEVTNDNWKGRHGSQIIS